jgi:hypothetical protein
MLVPRPEARPRLQLTCEANRVTNFTFRHIFTNRTVHHDHHQLGKNSRGEEHRDT